MVMFLSRRTRESSLPNPCICIRICWNLGRQRYEQTQGFHCINCPLICHASYYSLFTTNSLLTFLPRWRYSSLVASSSYSLRISNVQSRDNTSFFNTSERTIPFPHITLNFGPVPWDICLSSSVTPRHVGCQVLVGLIMYKIDFGG